MATLRGLFESAAEEFTSIYDPSFAAKFDRFGRARVVLVSAFFSSAFLMICVEIVLFSNDPYSRFHLQIGDASHGTSEFYEARAEITKRLVEKHGFNIVAVEADWPDARSIDQYVRQQTTTPTTASQALDAFERFPKWMWRNQEVQGFIEWLHDHNAARSDVDKTTFCGLDLYSLGASIHAVIAFLDKVDPEAAKNARKRYGCLEPWVKDPTEYGLMALKRGHAPCEDPVIKVLQDLLKKRLEYIQKDGGDLLDAEMNASLVRDAEEYYRAMYLGSDTSWNLRDTHMFNVLFRVLQNQRGSKAVVWAHNSHVGDARYTGMGMHRSEINIGQLCRERYGESAVIIGCGTHTGTVAAAHEWDAKMQVMQVRPSLKGSCERLMFDTGIPRFLLDLRLHEELRRHLEEPRLQRFIGVIYRPSTERWSHYSEAILPGQMDAYLWFKDTTAVKAFEVDQPPFMGDETNPSGL